MRRRLFFLKSLTKDSKDCELFLCAVVPGGSFQRSRIRRGISGFFNRTACRCARAVPSRDGGTLSTLGEQRSSQYWRLSVQYTLEYPASLRSVPGKSNSRVGENGIFYANVATLRSTLPGFRVTKALLSAVDLIPFETFTTIIALQQYYRQ